MLTPSAVVNAKPAVKPYKLADARGMYLLVNPDGGRWWRLDYRRPGTAHRNTLSLGTFPDVGLKRAREKRDEARALIADGVDPAKQRKLERDRATETFELLAREWFGKRSSQWAETHASKVLRRLEVDVFPWLGNTPVRMLTAPDLRSVLTRIEARGAVETAHRVLQTCGQVVRYAIASGKADQDITRALRGSLTPWRPRHYPTLLDPEEIGGLLRAIHGYSGTFSVACALRLAPLVFVRPGELRRALWNEFSLDEGEWHIPSERMKTRQDHIVPLSKQAVAILRDLSPLTGKREFVFPGLRDPRKPMSEMAINSAFRRMGYDSATFTGHGFRAMARTILDETLGFRPDFIEHQLAHAVRDPNGRAYNRTAHLTERKRMMQSWADYLDTLRAKKPSTRRAKS